MVLVKFPTVWYLRAGAEAETEATGEYKVQYVRKVL